MVRSAIIFIVCFLWHLALAGGIFAQSPVPMYNPIQSRWEGFQSTNNQMFSQFAYEPQRQPQREEDDDLRMDDERFDIRMDPRQRISLTRQEKEKTEKPEPTRVETMYSERIVDELELFGYDMFGKADRRFDLMPSVMPMGAVQDDYVLGYGDSLNIIFTGQRNDNVTAKVLSNGTLVLKDFPPVMAAGRTMEQVTQSLNAAVQRLPNTQVYASLAKVRQIGVLVVGHVKKPGRQNLTVFHTALDALTQAGGVEKTGSLRSLKLVRKGRSTIIDLYDLVLYGTSVADIPLEDGDRIIVPSIGKTVAVAGEVKRPAIYEMRYDGRTKSSKELSLNELLGLAGGVLSDGKNRFMKMDISFGGHDVVETVENSDAHVFGNGSILMVSKGIDRKAGMVRLEGHTNRPGMYTIEEANDLQGLLRSEDILGDDIYPLIGVIERKDTENLSPLWLDFPLASVLKGGYNEPLLEGDTVYLFSREQIQNLDDEDLYEKIPMGSFDEEVEDESIVYDETLRDFLRERSVFIRGAVRGEGAYPVADTDISLEDVLAVSGGLALEADNSNIEISSSLVADGRGATTLNQKREYIDLRDYDADDILISHGDSIRVNQKFHKIAEHSVYINGEVRNPGQYDLAAGDKLSDLIARAGGVTEQAYTEGTIFSRKSERLAEEKRFKAQARMIRQALAEEMNQSSQDDKKSVSSGQIAEARALAEELETIEGIGRITVTADPAMLAANPQLDPLLEEGDRIHIPKRNLQVRVSGDVLSSASLQFREDKNAMDYINEAGGFTFHADKDRTFVMYPDGSAQPLKVSNWNYNPIFIPPGSTIVVPRDPKPFDFITTAKDISQILSNLAITSIFIDDVRDD